MKIHRFYIKELMGNQKELVLEDQEILNQLIKVFRFKVGSLFSVFNENFEYIVEIIDLSKKEINLKIVEEIQIKKNLKNLKLAFSLLKKENTELVLEKCTELGVTSFQLLISDRTVKTGFNFLRANKIIKEAIEQSGGNFLPEINSNLLDLKVFLNYYIENNRESEILIIDFLGENIISFMNSNKFFKDKEYVVLVGPEGGFSPEEKDFFNKNKLKTISLGDRILRAETACIVSCFTLLS